MNWQSLIELEIEQQMKKAAGNISMTLYREGIRVYIPRTTVINFRVLCRFQRLRKHATLLLFLSVVSELKIHQNWVHKSNLSAHQERHEAERKATVFPAGASFVCHRRSVYIPSW